MAAPAAATAGRASCRARGVLWLLAATQLLGLAAALTMRPELMLAGAALRPAAQEGPSWPGPLLERLSDQPPGSYFELLEPLVHAVGITYRSSSGPEFYPPLANATIPGGSWERLPETEADSDRGGVHGRTFIDRSKKRIIIAFRGICADDGHRQCQVDKCFLQSFQAFGVLSNVAYLTNVSCDQFTTEFDYVHQADAYVRAVQATYPDYAVFLTGHSLGGALAIVTAAAQPGVLKAVTFAPTAFAALLNGTMGLSPAAIAALPADDLIAVCDHYDCLINAVYVHSAREGSTTCLLEGLQEPWPCEESMQVIIDPRTLKNTLMCKGSTHDWRRYEKLLLATAPGGSAPQNIPSCSTANSVYQAASLQELRRL